MYKLPAPTALLTGYRLTLLSGVTAILWLNFYPIAASAQNEADLRYLLFEPVALSIGAAEAEAENQDRPRELTSLPRGPDRVTLRSLLRDRQNRLAAETEVPAEPGTEQAPNPALVQYQQSVRKLEIAGGVYEPGLIQELLSLSEVHQELGQHAEAITSLERASHINRVNDGLFNLNQIPIIYELIESHVANGNLGAADQQQEYLYYLQQKAFGAGSADILPALIALADWNLLTANLHLGRELRNRLSRESGIKFSPPPQRYLDLAEHRAQRLITAQNLYRSSIDIILKHSGIADSRLPEMERMLALTNYFFATHFSAGSSSGFQNPAGAYIVQSSQLPINGSFVSGNTMGYRFGRDALERRVQYLQKNSKTGPLALGQALIDLGDWYLLFDKRISALEIYEQAFQLLQPEGSGSMQAQTLFHPPVPEILPTYSSSSYSRESYDIPEDTALAYRGHIDVTFTNNRYGLPGDIEITGRSGNALDQIENSLIRHIKNSQFRPRLASGSIIEEDTFHLRYYFTY
ncbi:MAG: hypothetical protein WD601_09775 [Pseudohongiellaceae bacterium]